MLGAPERRIVGPELLAWRKREKHLGIQGYDGVDRKPWIFRVGIIIRLSENKCYFPSYCCDMMPTCVVSRTVLERRRGKAVTKDAATLGNARPASFRVVGSRTSAA